ncbi:MAG TPA: bifunctional (p)ppGpp synthetase/guanosine-3',5'-bis(diphosphate) 3'-pyrophosphohydrolase [Firmicutes bacterium]|nr:bifunctional (p)ppGpp synthetase/guanosine-3',5'-bis(diphosphate) 3'-pyrophosphohydrolase [Bacillota bacterium]
MFPPELLPLLEKVQSYNKHADFLRIEQAYLYAARAHAGQLRASGEDYIIHPLGVAVILAEIGLDTDTIVAALLHDVVEDTDATLEEIEKMFGSTVASLVDGVTKLSRLEDLNRQERQAENLRKMFLAMAEDLRVILIKLADRLHNMRTLHYRPPEKQRETALETRDIFAPLAGRLGISRIQWELEDVAFRYLEPESYREIAELVARKREEREEVINHAILDLRERLQEVSIEADISGRPKHFYSIYRKMQAGRTFEEIYDLTAIRVIVNTVKECYEVLGLIHSIWRPIPGRFKDYIAVPKPNMYQSLHTTVISDRGERLEIQIRTWEMHRVAETGIAAHWQYKEGGKADQKLAERFTWLRSILEWQQELRDAQEFVDGVKIELYPDEVFVFTPKGDVINLPAGSIPLDFAYRIHTNIGHRCVGAKVNGRIVPLNYQLQNGDIVEILTSNKIKGPSKDWLKMVRTSGAKSKIRTWFKKEQREQNISKGKEMLEKEISRLGIEPHLLLTEERLLRVVRKQNFQEIDDLYASLGYGGTSLIPFMQKLVADFREEQGEAEAIDIPLVEPERKGHTDSGIRVKGLSDALIRFSRCCNPVPGDNIIGYITRGRGVSIHTVTCPNAKALQKEPERLIEVYWDEQDRATYPVRIELTALDRPDLLRDVVQLLSEANISISALQARVEKNRTAILTFTIVVRDRQHLIATQERLGRIRDVFTVQRVAAPGVH